MSGSSTGDVAGRFDLDGLGAAHGLRHAVWLPAGHEAREHWPAILFLHGIGESGGDGRRPLGVGLPRLLSRHAELWPFVVVVPQKPRPEDEWEAHSAALEDLLGCAVDQLSLDPSRLHLTGLSQGGHGAWELGAAAPARWASVVPVCGYLHPPLGGWRGFEPDGAWDPPQERETRARIAGALAHTPTWVFHGQKDRVVPARLSERAVSALRERGAPVHFTLLEGIDHACWDRVYSTPELASWMAGQEIAGEGSSTRPGATP